MGVQGNQGGGTNSNRGTNVKKRKIIWGNFVDQDISCQRVGRENAKQKKGPLLKKGFGGGGKRKMVDKPQKRTWRGGGRKETRQRRPKPFLGGPVEKDQKRGRR